MRWEALLLLYLLFKVFYNSSFNSNLFPSQCLHNHSLQWRKQCLVHFFLLNLTNLLFLLLFLFSLSLFDNRAVLVEVVHNQVPLTNSFTTLRALSIAKLIGLLVPQEFLLGSLYLAATQTPTTEVAGTKSLFMPFKVCTWACPRTALLTEGIVDI